MAGSMDMKINHDRISTTGSPLSDEVMDKQRDTCLTVALV